MKKQFKVRDLRKKDQFKIDDLYLNGYAKICGVFATAVYNSLSRHAQFGSQEAYPSIKLIAEQHAISRPSVIKGIKKLEEYGIIKIVKEKDKEGKQKRNLYFLIDKSEWKSIRVNEVDTDNRVNVRTKPSKRQNKNRVNEVDCKDTHIKDTHIKVSNKVAGLNEIIDLFKQVNPSYEKLFRNTTQRQALERLVKKFGSEKVEEMINVLPITNTKQYAPTICTPLELENKLGNLVAYIQKEKQEKNIIGII